MQWESSVCGGSLSYLFWEDGDIFIKWLWTTHVSPGHSGVPGSAGRQLALLEYECKQGEERMPEIGNMLIEIYKYLALIYL